MRAMPCFQSVPRHGSEGCWLELYFRRAGIRRGLDFRVDAGSHFLFYNSEHQAPETKKHSSRVLHFPCEGNFSYLQSLILEEGLIRVGRTRGDSIPLHYRLNPPVGMCLRTRHFLPTVWQKLEHTGLFVHRAARAAASNLSKRQTQHHCFVMRPTIAYTLPVELVLNTCQVEVAAVTKSCLSTGESASHIPAIPSLRQFPNSSERLKRQTGPILEQEPRPAVRGASLRGYDVTAVSDFDGKFEADTQRKCHCVPSCIQSHTS